MSPTSMALLRRRASLHVVMSYAESRAESSCVVCNKLVTRSSGAKSVPVMTVMASSNSFRSPMMRKVSRVSASTMLRSTDGCGVLSFSEPVLCAFQCRLNVAFTAA